ncbi:MAG TPA: insulinase family protein, partial [Bacteroidia bacterium]|nr:insulinase family protein [Bacteroidia bacterium]
NDLNYKMWGDHYCRKNPIGDHHIIRTATPEKMKVIQNKFYHPNNSLLCIAGDVDHQEVFGMVKDIYASWPASSIDPFKRWPIPDFYPMVDQNNFVVINDNAKSPVIIGGYHGPDTRNDIPATYAADVFSTIVNLKLLPYKKHWWKPDLHSMQTSITRPVSSPGQSRFFWFQILYGSKKP